MTDLVKERENMEATVKAWNHGSSLGDTGCLNKKVTVPRALPRQTSNPRESLKSSGSSHNNMPYTYRLIKVIGSGSFGVVVHAKIEETGEDVAIKQVRYDSRLHNRELHIMRDIIQGGGDGGGGGGISNPIPVVGNTEGVGVPKPGANNGDPPDRGEANKSFSPESSGVTKRKASSAQNCSLPLSPHLLSIASLQSPPASPTLSSNFLLRRHPNIVQLRSYYCSTDPETNEQYVNLVMNFLPTDFFAMKQKYFKRFREGATAKKGSAPRDGRRKRDVGSNATGAAAAGERSEGDVAGPNSSGNGELFPLLWSKLILFQLGRALAFLHGKDICHRDIKPANILIDAETGRLQLCDFGSAKKICRKSVEKNVSYICSRYYRAPELLFGVMHYGCEVDMWSVGCIAAELLREGGQPIFKGITTVDQMAEIFKVLGAPSISEMYAMNPQSAAAMMQTHRQYGGKVFPSQATGAAASSSLPAPSTMPTDRDDGANDFQTTVTTTSSLGSDYFEHYDVLKVKALAWSHVLHRDTPPEAVQLVSELLCYVPGKRLTAVEFVEHPLFDDLFSADSEPEPANGTGNAQERGWRLPRLENGKALPIEMFILTETETRLYSEKFQRKMKREVQRIYAAIQAANASSGASR